MIEPDGPPGPPAVAAPDIGIDTREAARRAHAHAHAEALLRHSRDVVAILDADYSVRWISDSIEELTGHPAVRYIGSLHLDVHPDDLARLIAETSRTNGLSRPGATALHTLRIEHRLDGWRWCEMHISNQLDDPLVHGLIANFHDITAQVRDRERLEARERMQTEVARLGQLALATPELTDVAAAIADGVGVTLGVDACIIAEHLEDGETLIRAFWGSNPVPVGSAPVTSGNVDHQELDGLDRPIEIDDFDTDPRFSAAIPAGGSEFTSGVIVPVGRPARRYGTLSAVTLERRTFPPEEIKFLESLATILSTAVQRSEADAELTRLGLHDGLTGLPNRILLRDRIEQARARAAHSDGTVALLLIDLDRFKLLNDAFSHETGDQLLLAVAERLRHVAGPADTVARLGGDEFALLCESVNDLDDVFDLATTIGTTLAPPFEIGGTEVFVTASIGISAHTGGSTTGETFLREADTAMYRAKESGRARYEVYDEELQQRAVQRLDTTMALRRALDRDELTIAWQPEVSLSGSRPGAPPGDDLAHGALWAEALVRWRHPELGVIGPASFIDLAEETGLIVPLGEVVMQAACEQLRAWSATPGRLPTRISINLSPRQLNQPTLVNSVEAVTAACGVDPSQVIFEITESAVMNNPEASVARLEELHGLGFGVAVDDFGTGYSSLGYLRRLPVTILKIDQSFIRGISQHAADDAIVRGTIELAHALGLTVVAEGVETLEQRDRLVEMGCDRAQGYLWSRPVPAVDLASRLAEAGQD